MKIYDAIIETKSSVKIPVFKSGKTIESRYNPLSDAEKKLALHKINSKIVLLIGIGSGIFLKMMAERNNDVFFLAMENSFDDIGFLKNLDSFSSLYSLKNVFVFQKNDLCSVLKEFYVPAFYGNLQIIEQRPWVDEQKEDFVIIKNDLEKALKEIGADFSVQSHFGKIWQKNFFSNLITSSKRQWFYEKIDADKSAIIVAAGPSLDSTIAIIKKNIGNFFIISTDTAFSTLIKHDIVPHMVISIDGQNISYAHFQQNAKDLRTIFVFDFCGNSMAVQKLVENQCKVFFINTGHPFVTKLSALSDNSIPQISAGTGTVTIAGFNMALNMGFKKIMIFGADFAYIDGKTYAKGTYLDSQYIHKSDRISTLENHFETLLYRTELKKIHDQKYTTEILQSYKNSLEEFLYSDRRINRFSHEKDIYDIEIKTDCNSDNDFENKKQLKIIKSQDLNSQAFFAELKTGIEKFESFLKNHENINFSHIQDFGLTGFLPYIAFLRFAGKHSEHSFSEFMKLAFKNIVRYNY